MVYHERVAKMTTKVVPGLLYGLAIIVAVARTGIRWHQYRRLSLDDFFVIFAMICLTAATIVLYLSFSTTYEVETFLLDPTAGELSADFFQQVEWYQKGTYIYLSLGWAVIFSIKASFLCFFKQLIDRLHGIMVYWRLVVATTAAVFVVSVAAEFIACPRFGLSALRCSIPKVYAISYVSISLDMTTDLMIMAVPIWVLWQIRLKRRQKLSLALFLCLNSAMIVVAAIRMSGIRAAGGSTEDIIWALLWHQVESCIAVITVSLIAFRSAVVTERSQKAKKRRWYAPAEGLWNRKKRPTETGDNVGNLPDIPSATLSGMNTLIHGKPGLAKDHSKNDAAEVFVEDDLEKLAV